MAMTKVLVVDDDEVVRFILAELLDQKGFEVTTAASVTDALKRISSASFDVLLSDLHMPGAGDGLTVVSAMKHANPNAVTMLLSAFPEMDAAANAIMRQADEVLVKSADLEELVGMIEQRLATGPLNPRVIESVASILERATSDCIAGWYQGVEKEETLMAIPMSREERTRHLPYLFRDLVTRLRSSAPLGSKQLISYASAKHGVDRRKQGYTAAMMVEESRLLQVNIFNTLQKNLAGIDFSQLLNEVMTIADEVDHQLSQAMSSYTTELLADDLPVSA